MENYLFIGFVILLFVGIFVWGHKLRKAELTRRSLLSPEARAAEEYQEWLDSTW